MLEAAVLKINSSKVLHGITTGLQLHSFSLLDYLYNAGRKHVWEKNMLIKQGFLFHLSYKKFWLRSKVVFLDNSTCIACHFYIQAFLSL